MAENFQKMTAVNASCKEEIYKLKLVIKLHMYEAYLIASTPHTSVTPHTTVYAFKHSLTQFPLYPKTRSNCFTYRSYFVLVEQDVTEHNTSQIRSDSCIWFDVDVVEAVRATKPNTCISLRKCIVSHMCFFHNVGNVLLGQRLLEATYNPTSLLITEYHRCYGWNRYFGSEP